MTTFTQGDPLKNITTTQTQATTAPEWYTDYLKNLSTNATTAGSAANFVGATDMQNQAFDLTSQNVGNYQPNLNAANALTMNSATTLAPSMVNQYMNPYISGVVDEAGRLGMQNIRNTLAPQATAGAVGSGQFGSTRGANVLGQNITGALQTLGGQQQGLLAGGYKDAITAAQADLQRQMSGGAQMGALAKSTQDMGLADVNALSTMGANKQQILQNEQLFPLQLAEQQAKIMRGFTVPTSVSSSYTGPIPGAYQTSPLAMLTSLGSGLAGMFTTPAGGGATIWDNFTKALKGFGGSGGGGGYGSGEEFDDIVTPP
jgi:hypothetical protein